MGEAAVFAAVWLERPALGPALPWLPWLIWAALSAAFGAQPLAALPILARWVAVLAFFSLAAALDQKEREAWVKALLASTVVLATAALWTGARFGFRASMTGLLPPYYNYTTFALSAGVAAGAAWALHPRTTRREFRLAGLGAAFLGAVCLVLAHGRGAVLGVLIAAVAWAARRWGVKAGLAALAAAGLAVAAFQTDILPSSVRAYVLHHGAIYGDVRLNIWRRAVEIADGNKCLGVGPGSFGPAFRLHPVEAIGGQARWGFSTDYAHSEPFQAAAETGWVGFILWIFGLGASLSVLFGRAREEPAREAAAIAAVAMAVHLAVDNMLQLPGLSFLFFSSFAVAGAGPSGWRRWPRAAIIAGAFLAAIGWIPSTLGDPARSAVVFPREAGPREDLAYRAMAAGDRAGADALWAQAEERAPYNAIYPWRRAQLAAVTGRWDEVEALAARAAAVEPGFLNDRVLRAEALQRLGRTRDARAELEAVLRVFHERGNRRGSSSYDGAVWDFDRKEYDRVAALAGSASR